jgi:dehydrogenase/reductase SDR family member 7B
MKKDFFDNKICWITGASGGIGAALAISLNSIGARLILSARNNERLEIIKTACQHPHKVVILPFNLEETSLLTEFAMKAWNIFNGIDFVFLNAGMAVRDMIIQTDMEMIHKVMNINFFSNVVISKTLLPHMRKRDQGRFIITSSLCGKFGIPKLGAYSASKHAMHGFFESLRAEHENEGITVTMITAGLIKTDITLHALKGDGSVYGKMQDSIAGGISPETCAHGIIKAVARGKHEVLVGGVETFSVVIKRFFPGLLRQVIAKHPIRKLRQTGFFGERNNNISTFNPDSIKRND